MTFRCLQFLTVYFYNMRKFISLCFADINVKKKVYENEES